MRPKEEFPAWINSMWKTSLPPEKLETFLLPELLTLPKLFLGGTDHYFYFFFSFEPLEQNYHFATLDHDPFAHSLLALEASTDPLALFI